MMAAHNMFRNDRNIEYESYYATNPAKIYQVNGQSHHYIYLIFPSLSSTNMTLKA